MYRQKNLSVRAFLCMALALSPCLFAQEPAEGESLSQHQGDTSTTGAPSQTGEPIPAAEMSPDAAPPDPFIDALNRELDEPVTVSEPEVLPEADDEPRSGFIYSMRAISALFAVLGLILFTGYLIRKLGKRIPLLAGAELGTILGRIYLARGTALHFVKTGGRVLVLGITNNAISLLKEFDADEFDALNASSSNKSRSTNGEDFLAQFEERSRILRDSDQAARIDTEDDDISSLRGDIRRLREFIKKDSSETED